MISKNTFTQLQHWTDGSYLEKSKLYRSVHGICRVVYITVHEFIKNELSLRAAALTFTILLSLVPLLAMSTAVVKGLGDSDHLKQVVYRYIDTLDNSSPSGTTDQPASLSTNQETGSNLYQHLHSAIDKIFNYVDRTSFATLGTFGMAGIVVSVILVLSNIEMAMNAIWHVESGRSPMRKIADYLALIVIMPISINIGLAAGTVLESESLFSKVTMLLPVVWVQALVLKLIPIFFLTISLYVIYLFFPNTKVKTRPALIGALIAGFLWFEAQNMYIGLQVGVSKYNAIYGSFATLPLFLTWIYFGWIFILGGAQLAFACQNKDTYQIKPIKEQPSLRLALAFDIVDFVYRCFAAETPSTTQIFHEKYPMYHGALIEDTTEILIQHNLIHLENDNEFLKPSIPQEKMDRAKVISAILGSTFSDTKGGIQSSEALEAAAFSKYKPESDVPLEN